MLSEHSTGPRIGFVPRNQIMQGSGSRGARACGWLLGVLLLPGIARGQAPQTPPPAPKQEKPLPPLESAKLPARTRPLLDPRKDQFLAEKVFVRFQEKVKPEKGEPYTPERRILEDYLKEYLRRSGHPIVERPEDAVWIFDGSFEAAFRTSLKVLDSAAAWKYSGTAVLLIRDSKGQLVETYELPDLTEANVKSEESAVLNLRRRMAKLFWDKVTLDGGKLTNREVVELLGALALQPSEDDSTTADAIVQKLAEIGLPSVPYLLEALTDNRVVRLPSSYPGLKGRSLDDLRVYHIADKALEEIFQKVSRMSLDISPEDVAAQKLRHLVISGWENEWRRFCKPFAESPMRRPRPARKDGAEKGTKPESPDSAPPRAGADPPELKAKTQKPGSPREDSPTK